MTEYSLSRAEIQRFHDEGYLGPFVLCSPAQMAEYRAQIVDRVLPAVMARADKQRHLDERVVYDLCTHPAVLDRIEATTDYVAPAPGRLSQVLLIGDGE